MRRVSIKTLVLVTAVLAGAAVCANLAWTSSASAGLTWLHDDPNQPEDPNQVADPNTATSPLPEASLSAGARVWLSHLAADPNEPNEPPQPVPPEMR